MPCRYWLFVADTGFLYALAYDDDRLHKTANDCFDVLAEHEIPIYANVISRMEFVDLIFRKQITQGAIQLFETVDANTDQKNLFNLLKNIRDQDTAHKRDQKSFKIDEARLKRLRKEIELVDGISGWKNFCKMFVGEMLTNEWSLLEEELGLRFIEVMDGGVSELIHHPLIWKDMIQMMGEHGLRGPDAMIMNLFSKSNLPLLITTDIDFKSCFYDELQTPSQKAVFYLES